MGDITMLQRFKDEHTWEKRVEEADKIRKKHPDRIPVICEKAEGSDIPEIDRKKYLVPQELTVGQFVDGHLPSTGAALMSQMYKDYKDQDGFLYITYSGENTFGAAEVNITFKA